MSGRAASPARAREGSTTRKNNNRSPSLFNRTLRHATDWARGAKQAFQDVCVGAGCSRHTRSRTRSNGNGNNGAANNRAASNQLVRLQSAEEKRRFAKIIGELTATVGSYERAINEMIKLVRDVGYTFKLNKGSKRFPEELTNILTFNDLADFREYNQMFLHRIPKP